jgi:hypothetical protein
VVEKKIKKKTWASLIIVSGLGDKIPYNFFVDSNSQII